jgi:uncharacterized protein (TIRG00374 family)
VSEPTPASGHEPDTRRTLLPGGVLRWIGLPISVLAILILGNSVDIPAALGVLPSADPGPLVAATLVIGLQISLVTLRWRLLLPRTPAGRRPRYLGTLRALLVGYLGNFVLPARLGEPIRAYLVARLETLPLAGSFASVILERVVDTASIALVAFALAIALEAPTWVAQVAGLVAIAGLVAFLVVALGLVGTVSDWLIRILPAGWRARSFALSASVEEFSRGLAGRGRWLTIVAVLGLSLISWALESAVYLLVGRSLGIEFTPAQALLIAAITVLATAVPAAPAYVGTFELAATSLAIALGVPPESALAFAVLVHVTTVAPLAIGGLVSLSTIGLGLVPLARLARTADRR